LEPLIFRQKRKHQYEVGKWKETITLLKTNLIIS
jgi:hypothetical protein